MPINSFGSYDFSAFLTYEKIKEQNKQDIESDLE